MLTRPIPGIPGYRINENGSIYRKKASPLERKKICASHFEMPVLDLIVGNAGNEKKVQFSFAYLMAIAFADELGDISQSEIIYKDGNPNNVKLSNLILEPADWRQEMYDFSCKIRQNREFYSRDELQHKITMDPSQINPAYMDEIQPGYHLCQHGYVISTRSASPVVTANLRNLPRHGSLSIELQYEVMNRFGLGDIENTEVFHLNFLFWINDVANLYLVLPEEHATFTSSTNFKRHDFFLGIQDWLYAQFPYIFEPIIKHPIAPVANRETDYKIKPKPGRGRRNINRERHIVDRSQGRPS